MRFSSGPRAEVITDFPFKADVAFLMRKGAPEVTEIAVLAERIFNHYLKGQNIPSALYTFLAITLTIDAVKVAAIGLKADTRTMNTLIHLIAEYFVRHTPVTEADTRFVNEASEKFRTGADSWFYPKVLTFGGLLTNKFQTAEFVRGIRFRGPAWLLEMMEEKISNAVGNLQETSRYMISELARLRRYGVKTSFFQDGILHPPRHAWFFMDYLEVTQLFYAFRGLAKPLAIISLAERSSITGAKPRIVKERFGYAAIDKLDFGFGNCFVWVIDAEGELHSFPSYGILPIRGVFAEEGRECLYEVIRAAQILRLYDLVVPIEVVRTMPPLPRPKLGILQRSAMRVLRGRPLPFTPDLVLPRVRALENPQLLVEGLEREVEQADEETLRRSNRTLRRHEVVAHIRRLPEGHHPSARAKQTAREELGIELTENETYVRKHERGEGEKVGPHRARRRNVSSR